MSLLGFVYFAAYAIIFGLIVNYLKARNAGGALGSALAAIY